jgi:hypothetical protein
MERTFKFFSFLSHERGMGGKEKEREEEKEKDVRREEGKEKEGKKNNIQR